MKRHALLLASLALLASGCAGPGLKRMDPDPEVQRCIQLYERVDALVEQAGVVDAEAAPVPGFPYVRTDRFLAQAGEGSLTDAQFEAWVDRLERLDRQARNIEYRNLGSDEQRGLAPDAASFDGQLKACAVALRRHDRAEPDSRDALLEAADVPPSYSTAQRVFGLYPLTSAFLSAGIGRLHREIESDYQQPLAEIPVRGQLIRYGPPLPERSLTPIEVAALLEQVTENPLGIPEPAGDDLDLLLQTFAPVWEIDTVSSDDRIGAPYWHNGKVAVDAQRPVVYARPSHVRFQDRYLLQLNYVVWFPARTKRGTFDLLAGHLDGITWRVTLAPDGVPLLYDTIHNCGCYHMFFPSPRLEPIPEATEYEEALLIPQRLTDKRAGRLVIRVSAGDHYVRRIYFEPWGGSSPYQKDAYQELRSLSLSNSRRKSLFAPNGLVAGSQRGERWLLWPSGVRSPGAMRQWGHHAVAFLGRRHFDDPDLLERYFRLSDSEAGSGFASTK